MGDLRKNNDQRYISSLLTNLARQKEIPVSVRIKNEQLFGIMAFSYKRGEDPSITLERIELMPRSGDCMEISFFYKEIFFLFEAVIVEVAGRALHIARPHEIFTSFKRIIARYKPRDEEQAFVCLPGLEKIYRLIDISTQGLSFVSEEKLLTEGQTLRNIIIKFAGNSDIYVDANVRYRKENHRGMYVYGLLFSGMEWSTHYEIFSYIFSKSFPDLKPLNEFSTNDLYRLYEESKFISLKSDMDGEESFIERIQNLEQVKDKPMISSNLIYYKNGRLLTVGTGLRIYSRSFLGQQLVTVPEAYLNPKAKTDVYIGLADFMLNHPYFENYIAYVERDYEWHMNLFENIDGIIGDPDKFALDTYQHFECIPDDINNTPVTSYQTEVLDDPSLFIDFCGQNLSKLEVHCYDYTKERFNLGEIRQIYQTLGFYAARKLWRVSSGSGTEAYAVAESYSDGLNLDKDIDICRIYLVDKNADVSKILEALLPEIGIFYKKYKKRKFSIGVRISSKEAKKINIPTVNYMGTVGRVLMNREGLSEYKKLLMVNFEYYTKYCPLTYPQKAIWYIEKLYPGTSIGNIAGTLKIKGEVDYSLLEKAINICIEKNDGIRLRIIDEYGEPKQYISDYRYIRLDFIDFSLRDSKELYEWDRKQTQEPFNLIDSDLFCFILVKINDKEGGFYIKIHHTISDAWTMALLGSQIVEYYSKLKNGMKISLNKKPSYIDSIISEEEYKYSEKFKDDKAFWTNKFEVYPELNHFRARENRLMNIKADRKTFIVSKELSSKIRSFCEKWNVSVITLFMSTLSIYINRVTSKADMIIGTPILNRANSKEKAMMGMFVSTVPIRICVEGNLEFGKYVQSLSKDWKTILKHQRYPYQLILKEFRGRHKVTENLYDVTLSYQNAKFIKDEYWEHYSARWHPFEHQTESLNIHISDREEEGCYLLNFDYLTDLFLCEEIEKMYDHFMNLLWNGINNPARRLSDLEMMDTSEKDKVSVQFNSTVCDYPRDKTIHQLFEEQANRTPDSVAVIFENKELSYEDINLRSNQIANYLINEYKIFPDTLIGILMERSPDVLTTIFGILKAGGAYVPIDPAYPEERIKSILEDASISIVVCSKRYIEMLEKLQGECSLFKAYLCLESCGKLIDRQSNTVEGKLRHDLMDLNKYHTKEVLGSRSEPTNLAYVIYTSGSTGKPKGVMIEHRAVVNFIKGMIEKIAFLPGKRILGLTTISFDIFVLETLLPLTNGLTVVLANGEQQKNPNLLSKLILNHRVDMVQITPSRLKTFLSEVNTFSCLETLKEIMIGGEELPYAVLEALKEKTTARIYNMYGPTETTVWSTVSDLTECKEINIGKPIANTQIYIADPSLNLLPIGMIGELCIAGDGLARGYLNRPELNKEKFVSNLYDRVGVMYRTGDLAKWLPDGNIEFIGRGDNQVKIRGFRIELGEIENCLIRHEGIKEAVVIAKRDLHDNVFLCAYIVKVKDITPAELKGYLANELPDYMIPAYFVEMKKIPQTISGKIDRKALPEIDLAAGGSEYEAPEDEIESKMLSIWQKILSVESIGVNNSFFEVGGDSLNAFELMCKIYREFNVDISLKEIFELKTVKKISQVIKKAEDNTLYSIQAVEEKTYYSVSSEQKRMFLLSQKEGIGVNYNIPIPISIEGEIDILRLESVFKKIIERHEAFRTSFEIIEGQILQKIHRNLDFALEFVEIDQKNQHIDEVIRKEIRPFVLGNAPLVRAVIMKITSQHHILLIDMHHIISDGVSANILINEIVKLYEGIDLPLQKLQYKDYVGWQLKFIRTQKFKAQKEYWKGVLAEETPSLNMPLDFKRSDIQTFNGKTVKYKVGMDQIKKVDSFVKEQGITLNTLFMAVYALILNKYTRQEDIIVGSIVAGRGHPDLENVIGVFNNFLPIRFNIRKEDTFAEYLETTHKLMINAYENMNYPYDRMVEEAGKKSERLRNPLFDTALNFHSEFDIGSIDLTVSTGEQCLRFNIYELDTKVSRLDFKLDVFLNKGKALALVLEYNTNLFKDETMAKFIDCFINLLEQVLSDPYNKLKDLEIISGKEKQQILFDFNNTEAEYPREKTIHNLFEKQVERTPENIAIAFGDIQMTYRELNKKANRLGIYLAKKGVTPESIVGIMTEPSVEMVLGILGILKAGGAYLPIDPDYPKDRIQFMLEDCKTKFLITKGGLSHKVEFNGEIIDLENDEVFREDSYALPESMPSNLAYIIYTSGTTGIPKGVMIEHRNVVRLICNDKVLFDFNEKDVWTLFHSFCFDFSVWEIFGALLYGGKLVIVSKKTARDTKEFLNLLLKNKVTVLNQTPSAFYNLIAEESKHLEPKLGLRYVIFGGEALKPLRLKEWRQRYLSAKLINMYGITETTVHVTFKEVTEKDIENNLSNVGKPIPTLKVYIMDEDRKLLPIGAAGEIYVGGDGVGRGYLSRPELTAQRFVSSPYNREEILYKSGDLARYLPDGDIEYLGRIDQQVKIRGHRVELGEIESRLREHPCIKEAIVIAQEGDTGNKQLCAYFAADKDLTVQEIRCFVAATLPGYMIPSHFAVIERIPLTQNGKLDIKALQNLSKQLSVETEYIKPTTELELKLEAIFSEILGIPKLGVDGNFFELGADSLSIMRSLSKLYVHNWGLTFQDLYDYPTIRMLSKKIETGSYNTEKIDESMILEVARKHDGKDLILNKERISYSNVLLTGATGFLGVHILKQLLETTKAAIYCLVRGENQGASEKRLLELIRFYFGNLYDGQLGKRIYVIRGDISLEGLGISEQEYKELGSKVDLVIHTAALVKYYGDYSEFYNVNVLGTKRIIEFCSMFKKKLGYVSTIGISGIYTVKQSKDNPAFCENDLYIGQKYTDNVYVRSKFEAESLIHQAINNGLNAVVFRAGNLTGRYDDGHFQVNIDENAFYRVLKSIGKLEVIPEETLDKDIELTPVDYISDAIIKLICVDEASRKVFHMFNHKKIKIKKIMEIVNDQGFNIRVLSGTQFKKVINDFSKDQEKQDILSGVVTDFDYEKMFSNSYIVDIRSRFTYDLLSRIEFQWPEINRKYIKRLLDYMQRVKYLEA
ncbi:MAG: amino acid adenylation domain-containing protein [Clostridia bacterium]|nr:amino acid adenylation domain-containing protein [Clostridia bacterium]